jgi:hypothetical protein
MTPKARTAKKTGARRAAPARKTEKPARAAAREAAPAARIRELEEEVRRLRAELALAAHEEDALISEPAAIVHGPATADSLEESGGRKTPARAIPEEEEEPFEDYDEDADLLAPNEGMLQRRHELDRERADRDLEQGDEPYWWVCPKCGEHMSEHEFDNIKVERCESCGGVTIDRAEIEQLLLFSEADHALAVRVRGLLQ